MAGHGITDLRPALRRYRIRDIPGFETREKAGREDQTRARSLRRQARVDFEQAEALLALARKLDPDATPRPQTPASRRYMRQHRARIAGWLWHVYNAAGETKPVLFTLLPAQMSFNSEQLRQISARKLSEQLKADLRRAGSASSNGYLFAALDGEYDPTTNLFRLHWHGMAAGGLADVVDRLRTQRKYAPRGKSLAQDAVRFPVRVRHGR